MEHVLIGLKTFLTLQNVLALVAGQVIGVIIGAIPGLTVTMAIALLLPFTFSMSPTVAILLLVGVYKAGIYAGSISAILIKAPGTPAAACTVLDGWPMAQQGQARRALDMALYASCLADFVSNLALLLFAGAIASFALRFGPPEFFWLIAFALTVVTAVSGASLLKGLVSAILGVLLSLVGMDLVYGTPRLTFGVLELSGGLSFVPLLIGLFAVAEIFGFYGQSSGTIQRNRSAGEHLRWEEFKMFLPTILRGSLIGVIIGAIPGTGPAIASFLSYAEAKRTSKRSQNFGRGEIEGVAASESGNNGTAGATLIPLLALGIPGDVITAVMFGAFLIHGIDPGPTLFTRQGNFVYALIWGIMLSSIVLFVTGKLAVLAFARTTSISSHILMPIVLVFCIYGTYSINNSTFDVLVMLGAGLLGYAMNKLDMAVAPLLIGFVLGPIFEDNLRRTVLIARGDYMIFFQGPLVWIFIALTVLSVVVGLRKKSANVITPP